MPLCVLPVLLQVLSLYGVPFFLIMHLLVLRDANKPASLGLHARVMHPKGSHKFCALSRVPVPQPTSCAILPVNSGFLAPQNLVLMPFSAFLGASEGYKGVLGWP